MKHNLPSLLIGISLFLAGLVALRYGDISKLVSSSDAVISSPSTGAAATPSSVTAASGDGQAMVQQASEALQQLPSLEVKLRYKTIVLDQEVLGTGQYWQLGQGPEKLMRMDLKIASTGSDIFQQEICTQHHFWTRKLLPQEKKALLERVDLLRFRTAITRVSQQDSGVRDRAWMLLGGMPRILGQLEQSHLFAAPKVVQVRGGSLWQLRGRLRPEWVSMLGNGQPQVQDDLGEQVPLEVDVYLGKETSGPNLFPYRIDYFRYAPASKQIKKLFQEATPAAYTSSQGEPLALLMSLEFLQPQQDADLDPRFFDFDPGDAEYDDGTQSCLARLGLSR